jgi:hypothetical protein
VIHRQSLRITRVRTWCHTELIVEGVVPNFLHVIPVGDNTVLNGILEGEDASLGLGLVADIRVLKSGSVNSLRPSVLFFAFYLLSHADHDPLMTWASNNRREDGSGGVVTGESGLAHAGAIVNNKSSNFVVTHFQRSLRFCETMRKRTSVELRSLRRIES